MEALIKEKKLSKLDSIEKGSAMSFIFNDYKLRPNRSRIMAKTMALYMDSKQERKKSLVETILPEFSKAIAEKVEKAS